MRRVAAFLGPARALPARSTKQLEWLKVDRVGEGYAFAFVLMRQEEDNWCWAAVAQAVEYARRRNAVSQQEIATFHASVHQGGTCQPARQNARNRGNCSDAGCTAACGSMHAVSLVLTDRSLLRDTLSKGSAVTLAQVREEVGSDRPVVCRLEARTAGHFICLAGWWVGADGIPQVLVHDPRIGTIGRQVPSSYMPLEVVQQRYPMGAAHGWNNYSYAVN